jgi:two-component system sensor histidine kinase QseC
MAMRSLRTQLLVGTGLGAAVVLCAAGVVLNVLISQTLRRDFDRALEAKAQGLGALVEFDEDGLEFEFSAGALPEFVARMPLEYFQIWRADGVVVARSPSLGVEELHRLPGRAPIPGFTTFPMPDGRRGRMVQIEVSPRVDEDVSGTVPVLTVALARGVEPLDATLANVRTILLVLGLVTVAVTVAVLAGLVRHGLRPVERLGAQIASVEPQDLSQRMDGAGLPRELVPIVDCLNALLARLAAAFERERRFTGDVAHELRTPLAGLRAKLEVALGKARPAEDYAQALRDSLAASVQMQRLVENLLQLARADAGQVDLRPEEVDVDALLRDTWAHFAARANERGLTCAWHLQADEPVLLDRAVLELVVRNLMDNATAYAEPGSEIRFAAETATGELRMAVGNVSQLAASDVGRVFERFWRANAARTVNSDVRCGLGLALCRALLERMDGTISAHTSDGWFEVVVRVTGSLTPSH